MPTDIAQEDATAISRGPHRIRPDLPTHRQFVDAQVARLLQARGIPSGSREVAPPREKGTGTVREFTEIDTDGNGTIDAHVFLITVFDPHGNQILFDKQWDYAPFGEMAGRHTEASTYDTHGNLVRYLIELHDPPAGRFHARFLTITTYEEQSGLPVRIVAETDYDADGTVEYREIATFTTDDHHHLVRMERNDGERSSITTWEYDRNGNVTDMRVDSSRRLGGSEDSGPFHERWAYTYDERHRIVKTTYEASDLDGREFAFSTTTDFDEHGDVIQSVASVDYDRHESVWERKATRNAFDRHRNVVRTDVLVTDNSHNDEFRHRTTTIVEYDDRERMTRRVSETFVDPPTYNSRILDTFSYEGDEIRVVTERDSRMDGTIESRTFATSSLDPQGRVVRSLVEEDRNADGGLEFRVIRSFEFHGNLPGGGASAAVGRSSSPKKLGLRAASSNPFRNGIALRLTLELPGKAELRIYDTAGRRVRTLLDGRFEPGVRQCFWDGHNEAGEPVASGIYFADLKAPGNQGTVRLLRIP